METNNTHELTGKPLTANEVIVNQIIALVKQFSANRDAVEGNPDDPAYSDCLFVVAMANNVKPEDITDESGSRRATKGTGTVTVIGKGNNMSALLASAAEREPEVARLFRFATRSAGNPMAEFLQMLMGGISAKAAEKQPAESEKQPS